MVSQGSVLGMESKLDSGLVVCEGHLAIFGVINKQRQSNIGQTSFHQLIAWQFGRPIHLTTGKRSSTSEHCRNCRSTQWKTINRTHSTQIHSQMYSASSSNCISNIKNHCGAKILHTDSLAYCLQCFEIGGLTASACGLANTCFTDHKRSPAVTRLILE